MTEFPAIAAVCAAAVRLRGRRLAAARERLRRVRGKVSPDLIKAGLL
jgi:hypothetical protein